MFQKLRDKIFFRKIGFKLFVVLAFFLSLAMFVRICSHYTNPYTYSVKGSFSNFIEFVEENLESRTIWNDHAVTSFIYHRHLFEREYLKQAERKGIVTFNVKDPTIYRAHIVEQVYSCDKQKLEEFKKHYKLVNKEDFWALKPDDKGFVVDCEKAKTIPLERVSFYFIKHELLTYVFASFVVIPVALLIVWLALRFIIISPILWLFKRD